MRTAITAGCLVAAATLLVLPVRAKHRLRAAVRGHRVGGSPHDRVRAWVSSARHSGPLRLAGRWPALAAALACGGGAALLAGPVAALVAACYGSLGARTLARRARAKEAGAARTRALEALAALSADLRAGLPLDGSLRAAISTVEPLAGQVAAATALAEETGAPLADLLDRVEAHAVAADRAAELAAAHQAGARATAWLLAALPVGGLLLGCGIGVDPLRVLLYTPLGAFCACAAVCLQIGGLAWSRRLTRPAAA